MARCNGKGTPVKGCRCPFCSTRSKDGIVVEEQFDNDGDILYALQISTYDRAAIERFAEFLDLGVQFRTPVVWGDDDHHSMKVRF